VKFSVLLPTRNGGRFLGNCLSSILEDPYPDMDLIVSDNANTDGTPEVISAFSKDKRLKVLRLEKAVSVTDNWNHALGASTGDYILMLGDDDCLLPGYFKRMEEILNKYNNPDCVTYNAYTYVMPDSINGNKQSYYSQQHFRFGRDFKHEGLLNQKVRLSIVKDMYRFRLRIPLNMQTTLVSRIAAEGIGGGMFRAPFPDHYALNALLLNAGRWVYLMEKLLVVGVSSKSFGHFIYSNQRDQGLNYLGIGTDLNGSLPGNELINQMYIWLKLLKMNYSDKLKGIQISRPDYVRRQVYHWYMQYKCQAISLIALLGRLSGLSLQDFCGLFLSLFDRESWLRLWRIFKNRKTNNIQKIWSGLYPLENLSNISEFRDWISKIRIAEREKSSLE
jgi:glycosyltransferase involved in cell wall biosynthesis